MTIVTTTHRVYHLLFFCRHFCFSPPHTFPLPSHRLSSPITCHSTASITMAESAPASFLFLQDLKTDSSPLESDCAVASSSADSDELRPNISRPVPLLSTRSKMSVILCTGKSNLIAIPSPPHSLEAKANGCCALQRGMIIPFGKQTTQMFSTRCKRSSCVSWRDQNWR